MTGEEEVIRKRGVIREEGGREEWGVLGRRERREGSD